MTVRRTTRRRVLLGGGATLLAGLAGCTADGSGDGDDPTTESTTERPTTTGPTATAEPLTATGEPPTAEPPTAEPTSTTAGPVTPHGESHVHGTMRLVLGGTVHHFGDKPWNVEGRTGNPHFHFHADGKRDRWHVHAKGVTLGYAVDAMPEFDLTASGVTYHGHIYRDEWPGTSVAVTVDGAQLADPRSYLLGDGDDVLVTVETNRPTPTPTTTTASNGTGEENATGNGNATGDGTATDSPG